MTAGFAVSERRACRVLGVARSSAQYRAAKRADADRLDAAIQAVVRAHPRLGYRRVWALLRADGWRVNRKRVSRAWRRLGFKVPKSRRRRRLGSSGNAWSRRRAAGRDHVWAWDFIHARAADGRPLKWLSVVDEFTRECPALEVGRG